MNETIMRPDSTQMAATVSLLRKRVRGWGKRPLTEQDFRSICKRRGIFVFEESKMRAFMEKVGGVYTVLDGEPCIILNAHERGFFKLWTMFHELGHYFLHAPELCFADDITHEKAQYEADAFAGICLLPELSDPLVRKLEKRIDVYRHFNL